MINRFFLYSQMDSETLYHASLTIARVIESDSEHATRSIIISALVKDTGMSWRSGQSLVSTLVMRHVLEQRTGSLKFYPVVLTYGAKWEEYVTWAHDRFYKADENA